MATIRMRKGSFFADIYDSEETIKNAMNEGYVIVKEEVNNEIVKPITEIKEKPKSVEVTQHQKKRSTGK